MANIFYLTKEGLQYSVLLGVVIAACSIVLGSKIKPKGEDKSLTGLLYLWSRSPIFTIALTFLIGPFFEEVLFRLIGISFFNMFLPLSLSLIITSIAFGLAHNQFPLNLISGFMGIILGYVYIRYGVIASFITHGLQNAIVIIHLWTTVLVKTGFTISEAISIFGINELIKLIQ